MIQRIRDHCNYVIFMLEANGLQLELVEKSYFNVDRSESLS